MSKLFRKDHRRSNHRPGQCAAAGFIDARDAGDTNGAQFFFVTESAAPVHFAELTISELMI